MHVHRHEGHGPSGEVSRPLAVVLGLNAAFCVVEAVAGWWTNSLALLADAGHMLTDVVALGLALFAMWLAQKPATARNTYGYHRVEILAALANGVILWGLVLAIAVEAVQRLRHPPEVMGGPLMTVALIGMAVNVVSALVLVRVQHKNLNVRGAFLHVIFDLLGSLGAVGAGGLILWKGWTVADPVLSLAVAALIVWSAWKLVQEAVCILMEGVPGHVAMDQVRQALLEVPGVKEVHDLHVWTLTSGVEAMSGHALIEDVGHSQHILEQAKTALASKFHIHHMTLQLETADLEACQHPTYHQ